MMYRSRVIAGFALAGCLVCSGNAQTVSITGTVKDSITKSGIAGATVTLKNANLTATTNASGGYALDGSIAVRYLDGNNGRGPGAPVFRNHMLFFGVTAKSEHVCIDIYNVSGRRVSTLLDESLDQGTYKICPYLSKLSSQVYFVGIRTATRSAMFTMPLVHKSVASAGGLLRKIDGMEVALGKTAAALDSIIVTAQGYLTAKAGITSYSGTRNISLLGFCYDPNRYVTWDNGSFSGCKYGGMVIVEDTTQTGPTVLAHLSSTADTIGFGIILPKDTSTPGRYMDSVHFSIVASDSAKRILKVQDRGTFNDSVVCSYVVCPANGGRPAAVSSMGVHWSGSTVTLGPGASQYKGLTKPMVVNLGDVDLSDSVVYVTVKDAADTAGILMKLTLVPTGDFGSFTGELHASLTGSDQAHNTIKVFGKDVFAGEDFTLIYYDKDPPQTVVGGALGWFPMVGSVSSDSLAYHTLADTMTINLRDDDIAANTATVHVKSTKDPAGFSQTLTYTGEPSARDFAGKLGFSTTATHAAGNVLWVQSSDTITVTYTDATPDSVVTWQVLWSAQ
jgi:hypothetical protein